MNPITEVILHIDDDSANRYTVRRMLEKAGYSVISTETAKSGLELCLSELPDLVILDINLPDGNGFDLCQKIKNNPLTNSIPVLQTSASFITNQNKITGLESGADGYLTQPMESRVLVATIRSLLRTKLSEKKALLATHARNEMLAIVSHDLRNPLSQIVLIAGILKKQIQQERFTPEVFLEKMDNISSACSRMNLLISDLMDVSQIDEGKFSVNIQPMDTQNLINETFEAFDQLATASSISLILRSPLKQIMFEGDKDRLLQLLGNLISNSLKFTGAGGKVTLLFEILEANLRIELEDNGRGIASQDLEHIFDRYWQGRYQRQEGIGLGLSIVKGIVDAHRGKIDLTSEIGKGTKFNISIPLKHALIPAL